MTKKHPDVIEKGKEIDISDLDADPVVAFQKKLANVFFFQNIFLWDLISVNNDKIELFVPNLLA